MYCHDSMFIKKKSAITIVMSLLVVSFIGTVFLFLFLILDLLKDPYGSIFQTNPPAHVSRDQNCALIWKFYKKISKNLLLEKEKVLCKVLVNSSKW